METILNEILAQLKIRNIIELEKEGLSVQDGTMETMLNSNRRNWILRDWIETFEDVDGQFSEAATFLRAYRDACIEIEKNQEE